MTPPGKPLLGVWGWGIHPLRPGWVVLVMLVTTSTCLGAPGKPQHRQPPTWEHVGEHAKPIPLRGCPPGTKITVNKNSGVYAPWQAFCYWGRNARASKPHGEGFRATDQQRRRGID